MTEAEVDANQLNRVLIQYLKENGLTRTAQCLQDETGVILNSVDDPNQFVSDITSGKWDKVMQALSFLSIPSDNLRELFNQITLELIDHGSPLDTIRRFIDMAAPLHSDPLLRSKLISIAETGQQAQDDSERSAKRKKIAKTISACIPSPIPSGRLLSLIGDAVANRSGKVNLLTGEVDSSDERRISGVDRTLTLTKGSFAESVVFSPDGNFLIVGSSDGLIEVFSSRTLIAEKPGNFMFHAGAVTALGFSAGLLVSGDAQGNVKTWKFQTAENVSALKVHLGAVNSLDFFESSFLTSSSDGSAKIIKSTRIVKDFKFPGSPMVYDAKFMHGGRQMLAGTGNGTIMIWDCVSGGLMREITVPKIEGSPLLMEVKHVSCHEGLLLVGCSNSDAILCFSETGSLQDELSSDTKTAITSFMVTSKYIYAVHEDGKVTCYSQESRKEEGTFNLPAGSRPHGPSAFHRSVKSSVIATRDGQLHLLD